MAFREVRSYCTHWAVCAYKPCQLPRPGVKPLLQSNMWVSSFTQTLDFNKPELICAWSTWDKAPKLLWQETAEPEIQTASRDSEYVRAEWGSQSLCHKWHGFGAPTAMLLRSMCTSIYTWCELDNSMLDQSLQQAPRWHSETPAPESFHSSCPEEYP